MPSTMLIITELQQYQQPLIARESFQGECKEKSEYGKLENRPKLWKLHLKSIDLVSAAFRFRKMERMLLAAVSMDQRSFGT